ncbi:MAG: 50S ribosomal protein L15 [Patescibacteria group bacterium]|nr:50S ribosomal protein L15 [Patescibacteria group bacterium]
MAIGLHNLRRSPNSAHRPKRIGRGLGSGHGAFSTRGVKGQRARSGGTAGINRRALKAMVVHYPKFKGMRRAYPKLATVTTDQLERHFPMGGQVDGSALVSAGLITTAAHGIKILHGRNGKLSHPMTVTADAYSASAKQLIEKAGGKALMVQTGSAPQVSREVKKTIRKK